MIVGQDMQTAFHHRGEHLVRFLAKRFVEVDLISMTKMYDGPGTDPFLKKAIFGLRDVLCKRVKVVKKGNILNYIVRFPRLPSAFDYLFRDIWTYLSLRNCLANHYDLCIIAHPRMAFIGMRLKQLGRVDVLLYDDWDHYPSHRPGGFFWRSIMRFREYQCLRRADGVASVSRGLLELRRKQGAKRSIFVPNGVDYALFSQAQIRASHPPTLIYMGSFDEAWGADLPIKALSIIKKVLPDIRYILLGEGPDENKLRMLVSDLGLGNCVDFCGWKEYSSLPLYLAKADLGVATYRDYEFVRLSRPLKIIEYMAAGLPVIGTRIGGEVQATIEGAGAGETIEFSPEAFASVSLDILLNRQKYQRYSENAVAYAREMDWERILDRELAFIEEVRGSFNT
jgi:glycosyltransferase involved in cell wall biosynthesis